MKYSYLILPDWENSPKSKRLIILDSGDRQCLPLFDLYRHSDLYSIIKWCFIDVAHNIKVLNKYVEEIRWKYLPLGHYIKHFEYANLFYFAVLWFSNVQKFPLN